MLQQIPSQVHDLFADGIGAGPAQLLFRAVAVQHADGVDPGVLCALHVEWRSPIMATVEGRSMSSFSAWFTSTVLFELWLSMAGPTTASRQSAKPKCSMSRSRNSFGLEDTTAVLTPAS